MYQSFHIFQKLSLTYRHLLECFLASLLQTVLHRGGALTEIRTDDISQGEEEKKKKRISIIDLFVPRIR